MRDLRVELLERHFENVENGLNILDGLFNNNRMEFGSNIFGYFIGLKFDLDHLEQHEAEVKEMYETIKWDVRNLCDSYISLRQLRCRNNIITK
jgi:hypothetical protein